MRDRRQGNVAVDDAPGDRVLPQAKHQRCLSVREGLQRLEHHLRVGFIRVEADPSDVGVVRISRSVHLLAHLSESVQRCRWHPQKDRLHQGLAEERPRGIRQEQHSQALVVGAVTALLAVRHQLPLVARTQGAAFSLLLRHAVVRGNPIHGRTQGRRAVAIHEVLVIGLGLVVCRVQNDHIQIAGRCTIVRAHDVLAHAAVAY